MSSELIAGKSISQAPPTSTPPPTDNILSSVPAASNNLVAPPPVAPSSSQSSTTSNANMPSIPFNRILSPIEHKNMRFLVLDCPTNETIDFYVKELKSRGVTDVVRVCEPTYSKSVFEGVGIHVHDWPFKDGGIPPNDLVVQFLNLCDERFQGGICMSSKDDLSKDNSGPVVAVHCVAGLGRAPVLVAIALIEAGMPPLDTIEFVRRRRRGAFNSVQLQYLIESYKKQWGKKSSKGIGFSKNSKRSSSPTNAEANGGNTATSSGVAESGGSSKGGIFGKLLKFGSKKNPTPVV